MSAKVCLQRRDTSGSTLALEVDPCDGRRYLTVAFDGVEAPFELDPVTARDVGHALLLFAVSGQRRDQHPQRHVSAPRRLKRRLAA